jgi:hypothetical protein
MTAAKLVIQECGKTNGQSGSEETEPLWCLTAQPPQATGPTLMAMVDGVAVANNGASGGLRVDGMNGTIRVGRSTISGNALGTAIVNGGVISSYGNNQIDGNTVDGPNPPTIPFK